jgi:TfoX/Sxy family transcriptional regulator of competence genes
VSETYLRNLIALIGRLPANLNSEEAIQCKHFFGGAAAYVGGQIFITLTSRGLALKLPKDSRDLLIGKGATPLRFFPNGPLKKDYVVIPSSLTDDRKALIHWIIRSMRFAQTLSSHRRAPRG